MSEKLIIRKCFDAILRHVSSRLVRAPNILDARVPKGLIEVSPDGILWFFEGWAALVEEMGMKKAARVLFHADKTGAHAMPLQDLVDGVYDRLTPMRWERLPEGYSSEILPGKRARKPGTKGVPHLSIHITHPAQTRKLGGN